MAIAAATPQPVTPIGGRGAAIREGDAVTAEDGVVGRVDRLIGSEDESVVYLVVRTRRALRHRYPVVPAAVVTDVDRRRRVVRLRGRCKTIGRLPETLPLVH
jgi:hypothetical protein